MLVNEVKKGFLVGFARLLVASYFDHRVAMWV